MTDLITTKLRNVYIDKLVYPMFVKVKVPKMWEERDKKTQEQQEQESQTEDESIALKTKAKEKMEELVEEIKEA